MDLRRNRCQSINSTDADFVRERNRKNFETRRYFHLEMDALNLAAASHGNFIWLNVGANQKDLFVKLARNNIYIAGLNPRPLTSGWTRVTIGTSE